MAIKGKAAKSRRRQYGTGSVYQRTSDGRWIGAMQAGYTKTGAPRRITVSCTAEAGQAECKRLLQAKANAIARQGAPAAGATRATVKTWAEQWLQHTEHTVRPKTWATNASAVRVWIVPTIGHKRLAELTPTDIRSVTAAARRAGRTSSTMRRAHIVLVKMLKDAVTEGGFSVPQAVLILTPPGKSTADRDAIPTPDAHAMLRTAVHRPDASRWVAAFLQGMRPGECLGLAWPSVDLERNVIDVSWQLQAIPYAHGCERTGTTWRCDRRFGGNCPSRRLRVPDGYELQQLDGALCRVRPKTQKGQRIIPLVPWMSAAFTEWRAIAPESPHGLVWPRPDGRPQTATADEAAWYELQSAAGVSGPDRPYYLYEARHTTATLLLEAGVDELVVQAIMGHASITTSRIYQTVSQDLARKAMNELAARLGLAS